MKTLTNSLAAAFAAALIFTAGSMAIRADGAKGGATDLMGNKPPQTSVAVLSHGSACPMASMAAMAKDCPECRTVTKSTTVTEGKGNVAKTLPVSAHLCSACKTTSATTGHGKAMSTVSTHTCDMAGAKSAPCCAK